MNYLNELQKYQLDFVLNCPVLSINHETNWTDVINFSEQNPKFVILYLSEIFSISSKSLVELQITISDILRSNPEKEIYIAQATSTCIKYGLDPLINLIYWRGFLTRKFINVDSENILIFDTTLYENPIKSNKGILSVRKQTYQRDYIFNNITEFDGIFRYNKWPRDFGEETKQNYLKKVNLNNFLSWSQLIDEYKSSYFSFIIESHSNSNLNQLSEKTLIGFLTKTIPVVLGGRGYIKELQDMGFWVGNDIFEIDIDNTPSDSFIRYDMYIDTIKKYNQLSNEAVSKIYNENYFKIQKNFEIVSDFVSGDTQIFN